MSGHKTSASLEDAFWQCLKEVARDRDMTLADIIKFIDDHREGSNLSSAIRTFVLEHVRARREAAVGAAAIPAEMSRSQAVC